MAATNVEKYASGTGERNIAVTWLGLLCMIGYCEVDLNTL